MSNNMTVDEIKEVLDSFGIEYSNNMKKAELQALMDTETVPEEEVKAEQKEKAYIVLHDFKDLENGNKIYRKGDKFPTENITKDRLAELSSYKNKIGKKLIKERE